MLSQGSRVVVDTWAQRRMVDKVRTQPGGDLDAEARNGSQAVADTWASGGCIHLPGQDRRGNLGTLPGVSTSGFHASRFALASPYRTPTHRILRFPFCLRFYHHLQSLSTLFALKTQIAMK